MTQREFITPIEGMENFEKLGTRQKGCSKEALGWKYFSRAFFCSDGEPSVRVWMICGISLTKA
jgi:hypothetical protein